MRRDIARQRDELVRRHETQPGSSAAGAMPRRLSPGATRSRNLPGIRLTIGNPTESRHVGRLGAVRDHGQDVVRRRQERPDKRNILQLITKFLLLTTPGLRS